MKFRALIFFALFFSSPLWSVYPPPPPGYAWEYYIEVSGTYLSKQIAINDTYARIFPEGGTYFAGKADAYRELYHYIEIQK